MSHEATSEEKKRQHTNQPGGPNGRASISGIRTPLRLRRSAERPKPCLIHALQRHQEARPHCNRPKSPSGPAGAAKAASKAAPRATTLPANAASPPRPAPTLRRVIAPSPPPETLPPKNPAPRSTKAPRNTITAITATIIRPIDRHRTMIAARLARATRLGFASPAATLRRAYRPSTPRRAYSQEPRPSAVRTRRDPRAQKTATPRSTTHAELTRLRTRRGRHGTVRQRQ
jgi:hypothetical protein